MKKDKEQEPKPKLSRRERRERALDELYGPNRKEYMGNIWGWRFSGISFVGLLLVGGLAFYGVQAGEINLSELNKSDGGRIFESTVTSHQDSAALKK